jgi:hypothetical protein
MTDDIHDERLRMEARDYNSPGQPRRDVMWARIQEARLAARAPAHSPRSRWVWPGVGIAAVLVLGIGIGRLSMRVSRDAMHGRSAAAAPSPAPVVGADQNPANPPAVNPTALAQRPEGRPAPGQRPSTSSTLADVDPRDGTTLVYRLAVVQHLAGTEALLTSFRAAARNGDVDAQITTWARDLLSTTRLLQSTAAGDPTMRRLLDDLELVLVQIAQYNTRGPHRAEELDFIRQSIDRRGVLAKLRTTIPSGVSPAGT